MVYGVKPHICLYIVIALSEFPATSRSWGSAQGGAACAAAGSRQQIQQVYTGGSGLSFMHLSDQN